MSDEAKQMERAILLGMPDMPPLAGAFLAAFLSETIAGMREQSARVEALEQALMERHGLEPEDMDD